MRTANDLTKKRASIAVGVGCGTLVLCLLTTCLLARLSGVTLSPGISRGSVTISDVVLTTAINPDLSPVDNVTHFAPSAPRIWCVITLQTNRAVPIGVRWYHGDTLVRDDMIRTDKKVIASFVEPGEGRSFPEGQYRVEVYMVKEPLRTVYFTVGP